MRSVCSATVHCVVASGVSSPTLLACRLFFLFFFFSPAFFAGAAASIGARKELCEQFFDPLSEIFSLFFFFALRCVALRALRGEMFSRCACCLCCRSTRIPN